MSKRSLPTYAAAPVIASSVHWISGRIRGFAERRGRGRHGGMGGASKVEEMGALGVVELERSGQRLQHAFGDAAQISAFSACSTER
jgi:hypothetical protein